MYAANHQLNCFYVRSTFKYHRIKICTLIKWMITIPELKFVKFREKRVKNNTSVEKISGVEII